MNDVTKKHQYCQAACCSWGLPLIVGRSRAQLGGLSTSVIVRPLSPPVRRAMPHCSTFRMIGNV